MERSLAGVFAVLGLLTATSCDRADDRDNKDTGRKQERGGREAPGVSGTGSGDSIIPPRPPLEGAFALVGGGEEDLAQITGTKPAVVYFVSDTCTVCAAETDALVQHLKALPSMPASVNLRSIVVGVFADEAKDWAESHAVPWTVGFQPPSANASLLRRYCPAVKTPCVVVTTPERGIALARNGTAELSEIMSLTGEWK